MKRKLSLFLACSVFLVMCACAASNPKPTEKAPIEGYTAYESTETNIKLQYPENWVEISAESITSPETLGAIVDKLEITEGDAKQYLQQANLLLFDVDMESDSFVPSLNMVTTDAPGVTQSSMKVDKALAELKAQLEPMMSSTFQNFSFTSELENKTLGDNLFVAYEMNYSMSGISVTAYQLLTTSNSKMYSFTYATHQGALTAEKIAEVDKVLSSIEFGQK